MFQSVLNWADRKLSPIFVNMWFFSTILSDQMEDFILLSLCVCVKLSLVPMVGRLLISCLCFSGYVWLYYVCGFFKWYYGNEYTDSVLHMVRKREGRFHWYNVYGFIEWCYVSRIHMQCHWLNGKWGFVEFSMRFNLLPMDWVDQCYCNVGQNRCINHTNDLDHE